jgi:type 1 fimbriae regulatory protein FimB/type 1 fimbriae regulatory protein FimE
MVRTSRTRRIAVGARSAANSVIDRVEHRDATAILVAYRHALRSSELVSLRWDDVDFATGRLHVRRAKGGETAVHPISGKELRALRRL